jgi:hypothetical protein
MARFMESKNLNSVGWMDVRNVDPLVNVELSEPKVNQHGSQSDPKAGPDTL